MSRRVEELERHLADCRCRTDTAAPRAAHASRSHPGLGEWPLALGRSCLFLAGAYLLRSLTASDYWPRLTGVVAGGAYALAGWAIAYRAGAQGHTLRRSLYAWCAAFVTFPLLWEASASMRVFAPPLAAVGWTASSLLGLGLAVRQKTAGVLAAVVVLGMPIGLALYVSSQGHVLVLSGLLVVAFTILAAARARLAAAWAWTPSWLVAALLGLVMTPRWVYPPAHVSALPEWLGPARLTLGAWAFGLVALVYLAWRRGRTALGGADWLLFVVIALMTSATPHFGWPTQAAAAVAAWAALTPAALAWALARGEPASSGARWTMVAVALLWHSTAFALAGMPRQAVWGTLAVAGALLPVRWAGLCWGVPLFAGSMAWDAGLLSAAVSPDMGSGSASATFLTVVVLAVCAAAAAGRRRDGAPFALRVGTVALAAMGVLGAAAQALAQAPAGLQAGGRVALPTAIALTLLLGWRLGGGGELRHAGLGLLVVAVAQVLVRDVLTGAPAQQVAGFATLGTGLLGATRLLRGAPSSGVAAS